ncbi:ABC transporter ATP-binding protein [Micromonospora sp. URMC 103]|uniref:ABC transporter ATP-binding protein n=1 Tax=Micromonospora sp. URMC 103 TaxID=3423406 RepID=UPI003F1A3AF0
MTRRPSTRRWRRPGGVRAALTMAWRAAPGPLVLLGLVTLVASVVPVCSAWLLKSLLDRIVTGAAGLTTFGVGLCLLGLVLGVLPEATNYLRAELSRATGLAASDRLYSALNRLPGLARFEDPTFMDRLRIASQSSATTPPAVVQGAIALVGSAVTIGGFLGTLITISPWMALVVLAGAVPALLAEIALARRTATMLWRIGPTERREFFYADLMANLDAAKELRLFGLGGFLRNRMLTERRRADDERRRLDRRGLRVQAALGLLYAVINGGGIVWAVSTVRGGTIGVGDIAIFLAAVAGVQAGTASLVNQVASTHQHLLLFQHFRDVERTPPDLVVRPRPTPVPTLDTGIELRDVWFRYGPDSPWVLRGVDLSIPCGQSLGLVGRNGSGKSTLVKLLCRFYDPQRGSIRWDGVDLRDMDPAQLRERIGALFQDYMAYDLSAAENIGLGDLARLANRPAIRQAAQGAGVDETLAALPRGYDTLLSRSFFDMDGDEPADGAPLSGGQWQRVALARAVLRGERDLLIMDEPSASLDPEAEYDIHRRLKRHRAGRTSLLISHRLGALWDADLLAVLDEGRIVEQGTHDDLIDRGGCYARLFNIQSSGYHRGRIEVAT